MCVLEIIISPAWIKNDIETLQHELSQTQLNQQGFQCISLKYFLYKHYNRALVRQDRKKLSRQAFAGLATKCGLPYTWTLLIYK